MAVPTLGQKTIPLVDWKRFLRVADWFERTIEQGKGVSRPTYGKALIVKTPEGGIPGRDGETIFSATCIKCVAAETATPGEKMIHETEAGEWVTSGGTMLSEEEPAVGGIIRRFLMLLGVGS